MAPRAKKKTTTKAKKATAKKTTTKKTTTKKAPAKKAAPVKKAAKTTAVKAAYTKSQILTHLAEDTGLSKKEVTSVLVSLEEIMHRHLKKRGPGEFTIPGLVKCRVVRKPATKARKGINPFTGEETTFKAKPARNVVKVKPLKKVKEMAES